jgi:ABC-2 type transport system permease protein
MEWARLLRSRRWIALLAAYLLFGLVGPVLTRYQQEIFKSLGGGIKVIVPPPRPPDGIASYVDDASQVGLLVAVAIGAAAMAFDAKPEWSAFLRTRTRGTWTLLAPRFTVSAGATAVAFTLGAGAAWYETAVLIGGVSATAMILGTLLGCVYLAFAMTVVAASTGVTRSTIGAIGLSLVTLVLLPLVGAFPAFAPWVPSLLVGALGDLVRGAPASDYLRAVGVSIVLGASALWAAVRLTARREL